MSNQTEMDKITDELAEWICNSVCYKPKVIVIQEELDEHCNKCPLADYVCKILNTHNETRRALEVQRIMGESQ